MQMQYCNNKMRPDRSDAHLSPEEEAEREAAAKMYFDETAPKRHTKPSRSDYSSFYSDHLKINDQDSIPELKKLHDLESNPEKLVCEGSEVAQEYVETEYYKDLNCIDKEHHTTGTGFIKMDKSSDNSVDLNPDSTGVSDCHPSSKGNPATNEWVPSTADPVTQVSDKPSRSDI